MRLPTCRKRGDAGGVPRHERVEVGVAPVAEETRRHGQRVRQLVRGGLGGGGEMMRWESGGGASMMSYKIQE